MGLGRRGVKAPLGTLNSRGGRFMSETMFEEYALSIVQSQPSPPRIFDSRMLWQLARDPGWILLSLFGVSGILAGVFNALRPSDDPIGQFILVILAFGFGAVFALAPLLYMRKWYLALHKGRLVYARVTDVAVQGPGSHLTFRSQQHGSARGHWELYIGQQRVIETFALDQTWAPSLRVGSQVRVLVHPTRAKILVPIGP